MTDTSMQMTDTDMQLDPSIHDTDECIILPSLEEGCEDRKRHCSERFVEEGDVAMDGESIESLSLSPPTVTVDTSVPSPTLPTIGSQSSSPALSTIKSLEAGEGIASFGPTQLDVIAEGEFVWSLADWRAQTSDEPGVIRSPEFHVAGEQWQLSLSILPRSSSAANATASNCVVSLFLAAVDAPARTAANPDWAVCAELVLALQNPDAARSSTGASSPSSPKPPSRSSLLSLGSRGSRAPPATLLPAFSQSTYHRFEADESDWGFSQFCSGALLETGWAERGIGPLATATGAINVVARIRVLHDATGVLWHRFTNYDSKRATGYVGLQNQGATCYMNSFLQSIFLTNDFRAAVYRIPTATCSPVNSIPLALQRIFYKLQTADSPPNTTELTRSFGWDTTESFMQHDVQEFSRVLLDDLENKMKKTDLEGTVERLFRGKLRNVIRCTNVDYESVREESFYDLQLTIKGLRDLGESFERYVAPERLCGDNQYRTDAFGLQDAEKFVSFDHFPPVLHIHLERYAFDLQAESTVKIHDRFDFPLDISLNPYLSSTSPDRDTPQDYWLHSVLVHAGDGHGGHYFVFIRHPAAPDRWFKFDDTRVTPCTEREAVNDNFGGSESTAEEAAELLRTTGIRPSRFRRYTSAYLLVYIRKSSFDAILRPVTEADIPVHLVERIRTDDEADARRRHERHQQFLTTNLLVLTQDAIRLHSGADLFDPEHPSALQLRFPKDESLTALVAHLQAGGMLDKTADNASLASMEIYHLVQRRNKTLRPDTLLIDPDTRTVGSFSRISASQSAFFLRQVDPNADAGNPWQCPVTPGRVLIYVKWFDARNDKQMLIPLGSVSVDPEQTIDSLNQPIADRLVQLQLTAPDTPQLVYYEELKPAKITLLGDGSRTFGGCDLRNGDIVIAARMEDPDSPSMATPVTYFEDLLSWRIVNIAPCPVIPGHLAHGQRLDRIRISSRWTLAQLVDFVASQLELSAQHLRLAFEVDGAASPASLSSSTASLDPAPSAPIQFLRSTASGTVHDFLHGIAAGTTATILYEVTPMPAVEAETLVRYCVQAGLGLDAAIAARLPAVLHLPPYVSTVCDLLAAFDGPASSLGSHVRLLECVEGRCRRCYVVGGENELLSPINPDLCVLLLEPHESPDQDVPVKLLSCFLHDKNPARPHGLPFKMNLLPDEPLRLFRARLAKRLVQDAVITAPLGLFSWNRERRLEDDAEVLARIPALGDDDQLGILLPDGSKQRPSSGFDGAIRFRRQDS